MTTDQRDGKERDFGKHRTYRCPRCKRVCLRGLLEVPAACQCGKSLSNLPFKIDDVDVCARNEDHAGAKFG